jgi:hypothetical protein
LGFLAFLFVFSVVWFFFSAIVSHFISISFPGSVGLQFGHKWIEEEAGGFACLSMKQEHSHDDSDRCRL